MQMPPVCEGLMTQQFRAESLNKKRSSYDDMKKPLFFLTSLYRWKPKLADCLKYTPFRTSFSPVPPVMRISSSGRLRSVGSRTTATPSYSSSSRSIDLLPNIPDLFEPPNLLVNVSTLPKRFMALMPRGTPAPARAFVSFKSTPPLVSFLLREESSVASGISMALWPMVPRARFMTLPTAPVLVSKPVSGGPMSVNGIWQKPFV
mmetsp:Transcript_4572/g.13756  ORF Transcript_4572/g.13756 Transcript_4572/m.13756 type:complete len:204 (+) Transcript_4572:830-1441(+)